MIELLFYDYNLSLKLLLRLKKSVKYVFVCFGDCVGDEVLVFFSRELHLLFPIFSPQENNLHNLYQSFSFFSINLRRNEILDELPFSLL